MSNRRNWSGLSRENPWDYENVEQDLRTNAPEAAP